MMKLLVIGGTGFIGSHMVKEGIELGFDVTSVSLGKRESQFQNVNHLKMDITSEKSIKENLSGQYFDYVIHCGGYINHSLFKDDCQNVIDQHLTSLYYLIRNLDRSSLKKFLYLGSSDEYGNSPAPQEENMRERPISPYSYAKSSATQFLQMLWQTEKFPAAIARIFLTYGPGQDDSRFIPQIIQGCLSDKAFDVSEGAQYRDFCYISDTIKGCYQILLTQGTEGELFNIASGRKIIIRDVIEKIASIIGKGKPNFGKIPYRPGENMNLYADISKANKVLNWEPLVSIDEGLERTISHYKYEKI